ncbi:MAG: hypothetical protein HYT98_04435 [Candidatus Sungbacteria bacterium]|nr:hypothetical protein [Candidatus Sungbacteria bacterium]
MPIKQIPVDVKKYLKADLFAELGMNNLNPEERVSMLEAIAGVVHQRVALRLMSELSSDQKDQLETLVTRHPDDSVAMGLFLKSEVPNIADIVNEEAAAYKKTLIERMKA